MRPSSAFPASPLQQLQAAIHLSLLPGEVTIRVLPGDKMYQAMEIEPEFMRPAILHGFGTNVGCLRGKPDNPDQSAVRQSFFLGT